ncbi:MAG TPA: CRISPR-associated endonuclease Cas3'', partial [Gaiellales bacterium]|nr:CRISPR-associated endonuclease Cas3'' [Gaiellales bacterium]
PVEATAATGVAGGQRWVYAHSPGPDGRWQPLVEHLRNVAELARAFAEPFGAGELCYRLGLWHDLGKFDPAFQRYLADCVDHPGGHQRGPDHKAAGSRLAAEHAGPLALAIQGHHGGLHAAAELAPWLAERSTGPAVVAALAVARRQIPDVDPPEPVSLPAGIEHDRAAAELFVRLAFSALVDADRLDTERHFRPEAADRRGSDRSIAELWARFLDRQQAFVAARAAAAASDVVRQARDAIYRACLDAAPQPPGLFRLTVPTGGGKTRSGMAFALRHALEHGQRRVIVAVPFITITEQTAEVYRGLLEHPSDARPAVLEHHSGVDAPDDPDGDFHSTAEWRRLAAENWDAPVIVTTTVQLFESLFGNGTSRSRKLHRLAGSVIILDEAQALPAFLLTPILDALRHLCAHFGTTVVLSTATQPAFDAIPAFDIPAREIVPDPARYFAALRRVRYEWRTDPALTWAEVAALMADEAQALAVANTKQDALDLLDVLDDPDALHLSTLLCGAHRREVVETIRRRLAAGEPCRVVSTQVVEAGVDLDFPVVLRAYGPLDGIIQAAGRCNREGRLAAGRVIVFRPAEGHLPSGAAYRAGTGVTGALLGRGDLDPDDPAVSARYFRQLFTAISTDRERIQALRERLDFPEVAARFQMIEPSESVAVTGYGSAQERAEVQDILAQLSAGTPNARRLLRRLQPYLVSLPTYQAERYRSQGLIEPVMPGLGEWHGEYHETRGIVAAGFEVLLA